MRSGMALMVALAMIASAALAPAVLAQDVTWQMRYDDRSTGVTDAKVNLPASLAWKYHSEAEEFTAVATPAVDERAVYAPVGDTIYAIDRTTGALLWDQNAGDEILSSPALADGILYFGSRDNYLWAVNAEDGSVEWRYETQGDIDTPPVIAYGICYFGSDDNRLTALDLETRRPLWTFPTSGDIKAPPLVYRDVIVVGSNDGHIYCLNDQGQPLWSNSVQPDTFFASPVGERNKVIYTSGKELLARDIKSGRLVWGRPFRAADLIVGSPAVQGRRIYVGTRGGAVYGIDANRGVAVWKWPSDGVVGPISSSLVLANDMIVFRAGQRDVYAISADGEDLLWKYTLPEVEEQQTAPTETGGMYMPGEGMDMEMGIPGGDEAEPMDIEGPGMDGTRDDTDRRVRFENIVDPSVSVVDGAFYTLGDDGVVYGFHSNAPDNVAPTIADPVLEVPGARRQRVHFSPTLAEEDEFPERYAREIRLPGTPPIFLSLLLHDEGSGVNPDSVKVTVNGEPTDYTYDSREGLIWYIYDPRGTAANLANGVKRIVFEAVDWRGNRSAKVVSFTINNKLKPPAPPKPRRPQYEGMPGEDMPPGEYAPPPGDFAP